MAKIKEIVFEAKKKQNNGANTQKKGNTFSNKLAAVTAVAATAAT